MESVSIPIGKGIGTVVDVDTFWNLEGMKIQKHTLPDGKTYACIRLGKSENYRRVYLHRWILGSPKGLEGDHRNGDTLDNRRGNLRSSTHSQNASNSKRRAHSTQPYKGVRRSTKDKWYARLTAHGVTYHSCGHDTAEAAARAYDQLARKHHGAFARTNWAESEAA